MFVVKYFYGVKMFVEWVGRGREGVIIKRIVICDVIGVNVLILYVGKLECF